MTDRDILVEMQKQHGIRVKLEDDCQLPGWAERMTANALQQPDFRATVAAALAELLSTVAGLPVADYSTDGDGAELVRQDSVIAAVNAAIAALGLEEQ